MFPAIFYKNINIECNKVYDLSYFHPSLKITNTNEIDWCAQIPSGMTEITFRTDKEEKIITFYIYPYNKEYQKFKFLYQNTMINEFVINSSDVDIKEVKIKLRTSKEGKNTILVESDAGFGLKKLIFNNTL